MPKNKKWFWILALAAGWLLDLLFWKQKPGISQFIYVFLLVAAGYVLAWKEGKKPSIFSYIISILVLFFAGVTAWRSQPFTLGITTLLTLGGLLLLATTFLNGLWPFYRLRDYIVENVLTMWSGASGAILLASKSKQAAVENGVTKAGFGKKLFPILRGLLIAIPIVLVLGVLLASADPVFGDWIRKVLNIEKIPEYLFRLFYVLIAGCFILGVYLHAIYPSKETRKMDPNQAWFKPFLGWTETWIVLGAVNLLFLTFVFIQVRYLFGGEANISETGYTYAEYARRGFGELVAVAILSMLLYLGLSTVSKQEIKRVRTGFSILAVLLMANVLVILASSLQRLLLYENAYGFSQLRTHTHVFIYWLAALIVVTIVLELIRRRGHFALGLLTVIVGFGLTLTLLNVDSFIVRKNVERAVKGEEFDGWYLNSLSMDSIPEQVARYKDVNTPSNVKEALGTVLACRVKLVNDEAKRSWQSYNLAETRAKRLLVEESGSWIQYKPYKNEFGEWVIQYRGEEINCYNRGMID